jgi:hypothetical protein
MPAPLTTWLTTETARGLWRDAPADDATLQLYLDVSRDAIEDFGRTLADPEAIPAGWRMAHWQHARNCLNAGKAAAGGGDLDGSGFGLVSVPLDWHIQQLVRPRRAIGAVV